MMWAYFLEAIMVIVVIVLTTVIIFIAQSIKMDISAITQVNILMISMANNAIVSTTYLKLKLLKKKRTTRKCVKRNYFSQWHRAILEKDKLKIMLNGEKQYTLVDGGPIDIIEEKDGQYKCEVIMQGRSNFFLAPVNEIHRLNQDVWYLLETEDGKHGWIISKYVTLQ